MITTLLLWVSLSIIVAAAVYVVLAPCVPGGWVSALFIGGAAVFALSGFDQPDPPRWVVGLLTCLAGATGWAWWSWLQHRRHLKRYLERRML
jgi:hypothetical protein